MLRTKHRSGGFSLIESLVGVAVFVIIALSLYQAYAMTINVVHASRLKVIATALAGEQFEILRNLPYDDVGVAGSIPNGKVPNIQNLVRDGAEFVVETTIRNIDDPLDGTIGGSPNDLSPADYRLAELNISCPSCRNFTPLRLTTNISPRALETASTNGALFVRVFDTLGQPIANTGVHIENNQAVPPIVIDDTTDNGGLLQIVDAPVGVEAYEIIVSKPGYSTDQTYETGAPENPNPAKPHATVALQQLTQISFEIDRTSTLDILSATHTCSPVPSIDFVLDGSELIGTDPDVLKYSESHLTDLVGGKIIGGLGRDTYNLTFTDTLYDLAGTIPLLPLVLNPNVSQDFKLIVVPKNPQSLFVDVKDTEEEFPLSGATVSLEGAGYDKEMITGRAFAGQADWSLGDGQADFTDPAKYFGSDGNVDTITPSGEIKLRKLSDTEYAPAGNLVSSTFDTGSESDFHQIIWQPESQPSDTGPDSVKFKIATNNDKATWNFLGPDGTADTYYTLANQNINSLHNGDRYLRYNVFLQTANTTLTPAVSDISFSFTSSCVPEGQMLFTGLADGDYDLTVSKAGYQPFTGTVSVSSLWQRREVILSP